MNVDDVARLVRDLRPEERALVVHVRHAPFDIYIGNRCQEFPQSQWGNPHARSRLTPEERRAAVRAYAEELLADPDRLVDLPKLRGHRLGCWCRRPAQDLLCHGLVLVALAKARA